MSSSVRKINFPVAVGSFVGVDTDIINGVTGGGNDNEGETQFTPTSCGLYSQKKNTNQCNSLKLNMSYATGGNPEERPSLPPSSKGSNGPGSLLTIGISNSLSVISPLSKDSNSAQTSGLRHRSNLGTQIDKHLLKAEELRKISKGFNISTRNAVKRWFVLYDDSHKPIGAGESPQKQNNYPPTATHHDIILDPTGSPASAIVDEPYYIPAHLEYHDSERKWRAGGVPNKDIILKDCFNICRKLDGAGIKDPVIAVASLKDTLDIIFEKEQDMLIWLELLLSCQQGGRSAQGRIAKPIYENMWEVNVKGFKLEKGTNSKFFQITGPHRLVATAEAFKFFELGSDEPIPFEYKDIKGHKNHNKNYLIHTGRLSRSGRGEIEIDCKDHHVASQIYSTFERFTKESVPDKHQTKQTGRHGFHPRQNSTSSSRSSRSRDSVQGHGNILPQGTPVSSNYRPRSESWSNPTLSHSFSGTKHGVLPGHPDATEASRHQENDPTEKLSIPVNSQGIAIGGKQPIIGNLRTKKDLRYRTTSEGNHFGNIASFKSRGKSITSGSPMSPGSYMSSESAVESAGSSNSIDDTEIGYGSSMTPNADHPQAPTIFEESSAESWVDPHDPKSIEEQIMKEEIMKEDNTSSIADSSQNSMKRQLGMTSLIHQLNTTPPPLSMMTKEPSIELGHFPSACESPDMKMSSLIHSHPSDIRKVNDNTDVVDSGAVTYADLSLEKCIAGGNGEQYKGHVTDFLPGTHQGLVGVPIPRYPGAFRRGNMGGESMVGIMDSASSPSQTQYATIMNSNDIGSINIPSVPLSLVTTAARPTLSRDLTIATSPIAGGASDYMLMSPPPPMATPPVPTTVNNPASLIVAQNSNNINNNVSSTAINLSSIAMSGATNNCSGSSSSTSSLKRQTSIGNGSTCGVRSNISTLERNRRRISMLGLDEGHITSSLMTSSLTGSVSNPRDPSSSLITSPSSQSSYNPLSDGGGIDREDITGGDEDASVYTLMSPTLNSASETNCVPIPGANSQNVSKSMQHVSQSFQYNRASNNSSLNRRSGRRSVGSNHKDAIVGDFSKNLQSQNIPGEEEQDPYVHMSPSGTSCGGTTSHKNSTSNSYSGTKYSFSCNVASDNKCDISKPLENYDAHERGSDNAQYQNAEESSGQAGSRRGSKSSLSHLGSSPSAALTSHLAGPLLPLYTDVSHSSTTNSNLDQQDDSSPYLLMSPVNTEDKSIVKEECDNLSNTAVLSQSLRTHSSSSNPLYSGLRSRHRNRVSNSGSKRSSMCSDNDTGTVPLSNSSMKGTYGSSTNVEATDWSGSLIGQTDGKQGSRNSSLSGTPIGSLPSYNPSTSLHNYKSAADGYGGVSDFSQQRCSEKVNLTSEYNDEVYVPLSFGDDHLSSGHTMPLQDHEIASSHSRRSTSSTSGNIQIPTRHGQQRNVATRMSPASSSSLISGTPNSFKGGDAFSTSEFSKSNNEDRDVSTAGRKRDLTSQEEQKPSIIHNRAYSLSSSNRPPTINSSNSSIGSALGPVGRQNTVGEVVVTGRPSVTNNSGTSPNTMAARLGSWFRTRAGSVPTRPSKNGKRNRTQSEGEKNGLEPSKLPENHQLE